MPTMAGRTAFVVGIPREIKSGEFRVAGTPDCVRRLRELGCPVVVQSGAGIGSGFPDDQYRDAGAQLVDTLEAVYADADLIWKVKEILPAEFGLVEGRHIIYTYLHAPPRREMTRVLRECGCVAIAYEEMRDGDGRRFALEPMSRLAGIGAIVVAGQFCQAFQGGCGKSLFRIEGAPPLAVIILGGGVAGRAAAGAALAAGADVVVFEKDAAAAQAVSRVLPDACVKPYTHAALNEILPAADVLLNCTMWMPGDPHLVTRAMLGRMRERSLIVDVSADPRGAVETTEVTTHEKPVRVVDGVLHYAVQNIPSLFASTATQLLCEATWPGLERIASTGLATALRESPELLSGVQFWQGRAVGELLATTQGIPVITPRQVLGELRA